MNIEKKLDVWTKEKLITDIQKKAVLAYEERLKSRSLLYTLLFLGGKEKTTLKEMEELLGKETIDTYNTGEKLICTQFSGHRFKIE